VRDILRPRQLAAAVAFTLPCLAGAANLGPLGSGAPDAARAAQGATGTFEAPVSESDRITQYGPVKRGETLTRIARIVKHDETTLEQTIVGLHRHNPHAFIRNNMNLLRTGQILQVPEPFIMSSIPQRLAVREIQLQTADWESFQARLAQREAPARRDEAPAGARMNEMAGIAPAAGMPHTASAGALVSDAAAAHGGSGGLRLQGDAPATAAAPVEAHGRTTVEDVTPQAAAAFAMSAPAAWLSQAGYLAAGGTVLLLGILGWRRRRASTRSARRAIEPALTANATPSPGAAAALFASSAGRKPDGAVAAQEAPIASIELSDAPGVADPILVSTESEAPASTSASPIYNTLGGDARSDRASVACASAANAADTAAAALVKAGAAFDPLLPRMRKSTSTDTPLAA
jgi:FimV-like protein